MLQCTVAKEGNINIIYLMGELDASTSDQLSKLLSNFITEGSHQIILEMSELNYVSSNGLRPLLQWAQSTQQVSDKRKLTVCNMQEFVRSVFTATGFDVKFPTFDSTEAALRSY